MPLRRRLSIIAAASVGIAILAASVVCYLVVRNQLRGQVDDSLRAQQAQVEKFGTVQTSDPGDSGQRRRPGTIRAGHVRKWHISSRLQGNLKIPVTKTTEAIANGQHGPTLADVSIGHTPSAGADVRYQSGLRPSGRRCSSPGR